MQLHAKSLRGCNPPQNTVQQALCPPAVARSWLHRLPPVQASAALVDAPVSQRQAYDNLQQLPLFSEHLEQEPSKPLLGNFFDEFQLGETLGQGSYGTVRACTHVASGKEYAVKILCKHKGNEDRSEIIMREVRLWAQLSQHPTIAELLGAYEDANNIFIVQELLAGGDLQGLLDAHGTLSEAEAASAMRGVLSALAACHAADVCYGDVKPANFMLASMWPSIQHVLDPSKPKGEMPLRAVDFGCAQFCPDGCSLVQGLSGTPVYMAPEVITDHCHSLSMDVWASGVMLYQMLTAQFPFWDTDMAGLGRIHPRQILKDVQGGKVLLDVQACAGLSADAKDLIAKMLVKDPEQRITAAQALQHPWLQQQQQ
ncbi:kinase-like domain-containing protein [Scenedesmus sp. NREL 46B-D3]|nr:kinase-like domain-containing protein [Scenedesmus sp. NREL 46B-D3]